MKGIVFLSLVLFGGCASQSTIPEPFELKNAANNAFLGRNVSAMADRFGLPHAKDEFQGKHYMLWYANTTMQWRQNVQSTEIGRVGSDTWPYQSVPYKATTTSQQLVPEEYRCTMQAQVGDDGTVNAIGFVGKMGACQVFVP